MKPIGSDPSDIKKMLREKWAKGVYLRAAREKFPLEVSPGKISAKDMRERFDETRRWIALYQNNRELAPYLRWETVNHRLFGKNEIPGKVVFESVEDLAVYLNRSQEWDRFSSAIEKLREVDERLTAWGERYPLDLLESEKDLERLLILWKWMTGNPRPDVYLREIDLPRIDSKFTEIHKKTLSRWLELTLPGEFIDQNFQGVSRFEERYGFKSKPELIRFRFLDPGLYWRGCSDISLPSDQFCQLYSHKETIPVEQVFVVENDICGLTFPAVEKAMVVFGRGYHFDNLKECHWMKEVSLGYWGDLDTHGFAILDQFRSIFPHTRSLLMDRKTLLDHEISWGGEPKQSMLEPKTLTEEERALFDDLRFNRLGTNLRLEQEFIRFSIVKKAVSLWMK